MQCLYWPIHTTLVYAAYILQGTSFFCRGSYFLQLFIAAVVKIEFSKKYCCQQYLRVK